MPGHNFEQARIEIALQGFGVGNAFLSHECLYCRAGIPFFRVHLIAADMKIFIRKQLRHLADEAIQEPVS